MKFAFQEDCLSFVYLVKHCSTKRQISFTCVKPHKCSWTLSKNVNWRSQTFKHCLMRKLLIFDKQCLIFSPGPLAHFRPTPHKNIFLHASSSKNAPEPCQEPWETNFAFVLWRGQTFKHYLMSKLDKQCLIFSPGPLPHFRPTPRKKFFCMRQAAKMLLSLVKNLGKQILLLFCDVAKHSNIAW